MAEPSRRRHWFLAAALLATACLAPTLPLPPPADPKVSALDASGSVHLQGRVPAESWVYALNRQTDLGYLQITDSTGIYDLEVKAQVGDKVVLWYTLHGDQSEPLDITIR